MEQAGLIRDDPPSEMLALFSQQIGITRTFALQLLRGIGGSPSPDQEVRIQNFCQTIIKQMPEPKQPKTIK